MLRSLCLWLPNWPVQVFRSRHPDFRQRPIILFTAGANDSLEVLTCCPFMQKQGVAPQMPLAEAKALSGKVRFRGRTPLIVENAPEINLQALKQLAWFCEKFSPIVGLEEQTPPEGLIFDITGVAALFGGEEKLAQTVLQDCQHHTYQGRVAIADTPGAAWALAHYSDQSRSVVAAGQQDAALRPLPVSSLRISPLIVKKLGDVGIQTVGELLAIPRRELPARFGNELSLRIDQALGVVTEIITPERPQVPVEVDWNIDPPTNQPATWDYILKTLLSRVFKKLADRNQTVRRLRCRWDQEKKHHEITLEVVRSSISLNDLLELIDLQLQRSPLQGEVSRISVLIIETVPVGFRKRHIFESDQQENHWSQALKLIDRLSSRLGVESVLQPTLQPEHQPELAVKNRPWSERSTEVSIYSESSPVPTSFSTRPLILKSEHQPLTVVEYFSDRFPKLFLWEQNQYEVIAYWGPERLTTGWWRKVHIRRDYYQVEVTTGQRFWVFEEIENHNWWLHGVFD